MSTCKICDQNLTIELDPEDFDEASGSAAGGSTTTVPDDLQLSCGCHFHWQCLLDESPAIFPTLTCPSCTHALSSTQPPQILTRYRNEGGLQTSLDIYPLIQEEAYLSTHPSARPARAYLTMCAEGDTSGIIELLAAITDDADEEDMSLGVLLRYQDALDGGRTGLHAAIEKEQVEVVWMLLWLASGLSEGSFPEEVRRAAGTMGAGRELAEGVDIRGLRDEEGKSADDIARGMGVWAGLVGAGVLRP